MGSVRPAIVFALVLGVVAACSSTTPATGDAESRSEPPRVPNPPPKYKFIDVDASPPIGDGGSELTVKCGGAKPFVCPLDDGTFVCSAYPCVPDCSKVGCIGGEVCLPCDGGYRCVGPEGC
jgi:hypothetical protein